MGGLDIIIRGVGIRSRDHDHPKFPATGHERSKWIRISQPLAAMMKRNFGRIKRHTTARAQANRIRVGATKIIEPEIHIQLSGVILHERELRPTHRFVHPRRSLRTGHPGERVPQIKASERHGGAAQAGGFQKMTTRDQRVRIHDRAGWMRGLNHRTPQTQRLLSVPPVRTQAGHRPCRRFGQDPSDGA